MKQIKNFVRKENRLIIFYVGLLTTFRLVSGILSIFYMEKKKNVYVCKKTFCETN